MTDAAAKPDAPNEPERGAHAASERDDEAEWVELEVLRPRLGDRQFGLIGLFGMVTACGVYFYLERIHQWKFGLTMALGTVLLVGLAVPALLFISWVLRMMLDRMSLVTIVLLLLAGAALAMFVARL